MTGTSAGLTADARSDGEEPHSGVIAAPVSADPQTPDPTNAETPVADPSTAEPVVFNPADPAPAPAPVPVVTAPPEEPASFVSDWTKTITGGWQGLQIMSSDRLRFDTSVRTPHGMATAKVVVMPGDNPIHATGERSEVVNLKNAAGKIYEDANSGNQYYAFSYYFPVGWKGEEIAGNYQSWSVIFQLHGPDALGASPSFALHAGQVFQVSLMGGDLSKSKKNVTYNFTDGGNVAPGAWNDLVIRIKFAGDAKGGFTVWRRVQGEKVFRKVADVKNVATLQYASAAGPDIGAHYWKQGLYRGVVANRTDTLWMGPLARATSFGVAEEAAFGSRSANVPQ